jgi:hypothetical protein
LDFPSIAASGYHDLTVTVTGAALNDECGIGCPNGSMSPGALFAPWVSAANTVTVRCYNLDPINAIDPASGTFKVSARKV